MLFSNIVCDRSLRAIGFVQFFAMLAIGIFTNGCAAPIQSSIPPTPAVLETTDEYGVTTRVETLTDGTTAVSSFKEGSVPVRGNAYIPTSTRHDVSKRARLVTRYAANDFTVGK